MKRRNWILLALLLPLLLVIAGVVAVLLIPTERVGAIAAERATEMLGREVTIDGVKLRLFPRPGVALDGVAVAGRVQDETPVAVVERVQLRPRILPLLRRQVLIDAIILDQPQILVDIDANSISNLPVLGGADEPKEMAETTSPETAKPDRDAGDGPGLDFLIRRLEINDATLGYVDARTGSAIKVEGLNQRLRIAGDLAGGELRRLALAGKISIDELSADAPETLAVPISGIRLQLEHDAALDLAGDSLHLEHLALKIQELGLEGEGTVLALTDPEARSLSLRLGAGPVDVGQLIRSLPEGLLALTGSDGEIVTLPEVDGVLSIDLTIAGLIGADSLPEIAGTAGFEGFTLGYGGLNEVVSGVDGTIAFSLDSLTTTGLTGHLLGEPMLLAFEVHDLAAPRARGTIRAGVDLNRLATSGLLPDSVSASGRIALDLAFQAALLALQETRVDGTVGLESVHLQTPASLEAITLESGQLHFEGQRLQTEGLAIQLGDSDLALALDAHDWIGLLIAGEAEEGIAPPRLPRVALAANSRLLDLDAILGPADTLTYGTLLFARLAERQIGGRSVDQVAEEMGLGLPAIPPMELQGEVRIGEMRREKILLRDIVVGLAANGDRLELTDARFQMMGGGIQVAAEIGMPLIRPGEEVEAVYPVVFSFHLEDVGAAPFFDTFTPFREHLSGSMRLDGTGRATLDRHLLPLRESVAANGTMALADGRLTNWPALKKLGERLETVDFDTLAFKDWAGSFSISGPQIVLHETAIGGGQLGVLAAGQVGFNGVLDLGATIELPPSVTSRIGGEFASRLTSAITSDDGTIPIGVKVTGPATSPKLELDLSSAASNLAAEARREAEARLKVAEEKARAEAEAALEKAREKAEAAAERARQEAEEAARKAAERAAERAAEKATDKAADAVRDRLGDLLRGKRPTAADSTSSAVKRDSTGTDTTKVDTTKTDTTKVDTTTVDTTTVDSTGTGAAG